MSVRLCMLCYTVYHQAAARGGALDAVLLLRVGQGNDMFLSVEGTCRPTFLGIPPDQLLSMQRPLCADATAPLLALGDAGDCRRHTMPTGNIEHALVAGLAGVQLVPPGNPFAERSSPTDPGNLGPAVNGEWGPAVLADVPPEVLALLQYLRPRLQAPGRTHLLKCFLTSLLLRVHRLLCTSVRHKSQGCF